MLQNRVKMDSNIHSGLAGRVALLYKSLHTFFTHNVRHEVERQLSLAREINGLRTFIHLTETQIGTASEISK